MKLPSDGWLTLAMIWIASCFATFGIIDLVINEEWVRGTLCLAIGALILEKA